MRRLRAVDNTGGGENMKNKKKKVPLTRTELYSGPVSVTECTGLTASAPKTEAEAESYRDIAQVNVTSDKTRGGRGGK